MNIFVGNLPYSATEEELRSAFGAFGTVSKVQIMMDRATGRPRGFAFVEMPSADEANAAIAAMSGQNFNGRPLTVNEARPRDNRGRPGNRGAAGGRGPGGGSFGGRGAGHAGGRHGGAEHGGGDSGPTVDTGGTAG